MNFTFSTWCVLLVPMPAIIIYTALTFIKQCYRARKKLITAQ